jgi:hypothetical protein
MATIKPGAGKVKVTLSLDKTAHDAMLDGGYASARTMGSFISGLILAHHERQAQSVAAELRRLADMLDPPGKELP